MLAGGTGSCIGNGDIGAAGRKLDDALWERDIRRLCNDDLEIVALLFQKHRHQRQNVLRGGFHGNADREFGHGLPRAYRGRRPGATASGAS